MGIANCLDGMKDDILFISYDSDDDHFEGYGISAGEMEGRQQLAENVELEIDAINEWSEPESEPETSDDGHSVVIEVRLENNFLTCTNT